jgi:hypothetical protein
MLIGTPLLKSRTSYNLFLGCLGWATWGTTTGHQPRLTNINPCPSGSPNGPNREQQLSINPGSPNGRRQMGINPCPPVYLMDLMADNNWTLTQVHRMEDDKWASTHVHRAQPIRPGW